MYFDHAATSWPKPWEVVGKVNDALLKAGNPGRGSHEAALWSADIVFQTREAVADLFGVKNPLQIGFTENATGALNFAIAQIEGPVITTAMEHNSVLRPCYAKGKDMLTIIPADNKGDLDLDFFVQQIRKHRPKGVVMTHASNVTGTIYDVARIGAECRKQNILFIVDASQTAGVVPIHMEQLQADMICFTGHKGLLGPQGTGGIAVREGLKVPLKPYKKGGSGSNSFAKEHPNDMPDAVEAGTLNTHGIAGLLAGVRYVKRYGVERIFQHEEMLADLFRQRIADIPGIELYGNPKRPHVGIVSLNMPGMDSSECSQLLADRQIFVRGGSHCAPLAHAALGTVETGAVRFSFGVMNDKKEVEQAAIFLHKMGEYS